MERNDSNPRLTKMGVFLFLVFPHFCERQEKKIGCHLLMGREKKQFSHKYDSIKEEEKNERKCCNSSIAKYGE